jgi:hypothetical protein
MPRLSTTLKIRRLNDKVIHNRILSVLNDHGSAKFQHTLLFGRQLSSNAEHREELRLILDQQVIAVQQFHFDFPSGISVTVERASQRNGSTWLLQGHRDCLKISLNGYPQSEFAQAIEMISAALGGVGEIDFVNHF